jgi:hypothetical protein
MVIAPLPRTAAVDGRGPPRLRCPEAPQRRGRRRRCQGPRPAHARRGAWRSQGVRGNTRRPATATAATGSPSPIARRALSTPGGPRADTRRRAPRCRAAARGRAGSPRRRARRRGGNGRAGGGAWGGPATADPSAQGKVTGRTRLSSRAAACGRGVGVDPDVVVPGGAWLAFRQTRAAPLARSPPQRLLAVERAARARRAGRARAPRSALASWRCSAARWALERAQRV